MQKIFYYCFYASIFFTFSLLAAHEKEHDYIEGIAQKVQDFSQKSQKLLLDIDNNKYRISVYQNVSGFFLVVAPYSMTWLIDSYFPEAKMVKDALHYAVTPLTQLTAIPMLYHNFSQAAINLQLAEDTLSESVKFFHDLGQVCNYLKNVVSNYNGEDIVNVVEDYFNQLRRERTPVGNYLLSVFQKLQKLQTIELNNDTKKRQIFCEIFSTLLETIKCTKLQQIKHNETILNFSGFCLSSYDYLSLKALRTLVLDNYKAAGFGKNSSSKILFLEQNDQ